MTVREFTYDLSSPLHELGLVGTWHWDLQNGEFLCSIGMYKMWGFGPSDVVNPATIEEHIHPDDRVDPGQLQRNIDQGL
ncbi:hypothetical protein [Microvirga rosea]|uniref:hypothetical protein n=1 Tax=Microvirga rosea TaxID=2715425 RepID=UPI001D0BC7CA|nr:hypothetical protein [Microvirga rosea]MCB8823210.1 hypothetical protein [Microvirga rosea]